MTIFKTVANSIRKKSEDFVIELQKSREHKKELVQSKVDITKDVEAMVSLLNDSRYQSMKKVLTDMRDGYVETLYSVTQSDWEDYSDTKRSAKLSLLSSKISVLNDILTYPDRIIKQAQEQLK